MNVVYGGMVIAAAAGALLGGGLQYDPNRLGDTPRGPQQILSQEGEYAPSAYDGSSSIDFPTGVAPDYVIGTDWLPGGRQTQPLTAAIFDLPPYEPPPPYEGQYVYEEPSYLAPAFDLSRTDPVIDGPRQVPQVVVVDGQGGGQIDDLAHGPDPSTLVGEPSV